MKEKHLKTVLMCGEELKSVDYPLMDDILSNEVLKSNDRMKQKNRLTTVSLAPKK